MRDEHTEYWAGVLEELFHAQIPLTRAMRVRVTSYERHALELTAPLAPNVNDKGTGFGGSISALMTLAGWGLLYLNSAERGLDCDIVIHKGEIEYLRPVKSDFSARCELPETGGLADFFNRLQHRGRARIELVSRTMAEDREAAVLRSRFVALQRESGEDT